MNDEEITIINIINNATSNKDIDVEKLEKLIELKEKHDIKESIKMFYSDFSKMQSDIPPIEKDSEIKIHNRVQSKYASIDAINKVIRPILKLYGFAISFRIHVEDKSLKAIAILSHKEGHSEESTFTVPFDSSGNKNAVQAIGSAATYAKRYAICALLNISYGEEDDDGNSAISKNYLITEAQQKRIALLLNEDPHRISAFCAHFKIDHISNLAQENYSTAEALLNKSNSQKNKEA